MTWASDCCKNASSTWSPRLPKPIQPNRTRSLALAARAAPSAVVAPAKTRVFVNSRRVQEFIKNAFVVILWRYYPIQLPGKTLLMMRPRHSSDLDNQKTAHNAFLQRVFAFFVLSYGNLLQDSD